MKKVCVLALVTICLSCTQDKLGGQLSPIEGNWGLVMRTSESLQATTGLANQTTYEKTPEILKILNDRITIWKLTETDTTRRNTKYRIDS